MMRLIKLLIIIVAIILAGRSLGNINLAPTFEFAQTQQKMWSMNQTVAKQEAVKKVERLNRETDNLNVLFIGVGDDELSMVSLYTIDHQHSWRSAAIFFPVKTVVTTQEKPTFLAEIYQNHGTADLVAALEQQLEVNIDYHVKVDRQVLKRLDQIIAPIYIDGEKVDITNLFDMTVTPYDDYIIGQLVEQLRQPSVYFFTLPELFVTFRRHIATDFPITPNNLYLHYQIARGIDPHKLTKTIVSGKDYFMAGEVVRQVSEDTWKNIIYRLTKE